MLVFCVEMRELFYEHIPTNGLCIYEREKGGLKRLFVLTGSNKGMILWVSKEKFADEFRKVQRSEVAQYFEREEKHPVVKIKSSKD